MNSGLGLVGRKCGMTRIFDEDGSSIPVSVVHVEPNVIVQIKTAETDGYSALKVAFGDKKDPKRLTKPLQGLYKKSELEAKQGFKEFRVEDTSEYKQGDVVTVEKFADVKIIDVQGTSKGKGFQGAVKRHNFRTQDATHGNSLAHRAPGSIGQCQTPGRVWKGKKMAGHMGDAKTTVHNLELVKIDAEKNLLLIKGGIPGAVSSTVVVKAAVKKRGDKK